uniref:Transcriptional modulator of MazE/toxin, MazF n=1 Tax=Geobacillus sp. (strain WCH70) TaxID=471223 RepID=C5D546_GEOSW
MIELSKVSRMMNWVALKLTLHKRANSAKRRVVKRGEVYKCYLGENIGSEENKQRPVLIIQNDVGNINSPNVIVAPITNSAGEPKVTVPVTTQYNSDGTILLSGYILLGNIVTVSKARLGDYVTTLTSEMDDVNEKILVSLGLFADVKSLKDRLAKDKQHIRKITNENYQLKQLLDTIRTHLGAKSNDDILPLLQKKHTE